MYMKIDLPAQMANIKKISLENPIAEQLEVQVLYLTHTGEH